MVPGVPAPKPFTILSVAGDDPVGEAPAEAGVAAAPLEGGRVAESSPAEDKMLGQKVAPKSCTSRTKPTSTPEVSYEGRQNSRFSSFALQVDFNMHSVISLVIVSYSVVHWQT